MSPSPVHVLHCIGSLNRAGLETWLMHVLRRMDRTRIAMDFVCLSGMGGVYAEEARALGAQVIGCKLSANLPTFKKQFARVLADGGYDIVHSHVHYFSGYLLRLASQAGVPVRIAHSHTSSDGKKTSPPRSAYRTIQRHWIMRYSTAWFVASTEAANLYGERASSTTPLEVIRCGVDLQPFCQPADRARIQRSIGIEGNGPILGHVGRFVEAKNHSFLLDVFAKLLVRRPDCHLLLVGDGPLRARIEKRVRDMKLDSQVVLAGVRSDVPRLLLGAMDAFCFPSLFEGLPVAAIEAQAAGLPCLISTDVTREVDIVPSAVKFLDCSAGAEVWAEELSDCLARGRTEPEIACSEIRAKGFDADSSVASLIGLYQREMRRAGKMDGKGNGKLA